ncbi:MAG TPA: response regulator transcription factor [Usitatibacter sp.]|jgi:two-component system, OmpR family, response regulator|nr:response regulator transcription factor [Usitatibacter sp.]
MRVLIVEDDRLLANGLTETLRRAGYVADAVGSAEAADAALKVTDVDLIVLDIGLPGLDGFSWLRKLRGRGGQQSVLVLTARDALSDRVLGLNVGADDYLAKPFATEELVARVSALARRGRAIKSRVIEHGALVLDLERKRAVVEGKPLDLSQREYAILEYLFSNLGAIVGKDKIAGAVASWDEHISPNAIEVHMSRLRAKLEPAGVAIRTIRGLGYLVEAPDVAKS